MILKLYVFSFNYVCIITDRLWFLLFLDLILKQYQGWIPVDRTMIVGVGDNPRMGPFLSSQCPLSVSFYWTVNTTISLPMNHRSLNLTLTSNRQISIWREVTLKTPLYSLHTANIFCLRELWLVLTTKKCFIVKTEVKRKLIKNFNLYNLQKHKAPFCIYF